MNQMWINFIEIGRRISFLSSLLIGSGGGSFLWPVDIRWKAANQTRLEWISFSFRPFRSLKAVNGLPKRETSF
jgi:hypothetical protein